MQNATRGKLLGSSHFRFLILFISIVFVLLTTKQAFAQAWDYEIKDVDTLVTIDAEKTTAEIDTTKNEIRLPPLKIPDVVSFWGSGEMDYVVLTTTGIRHYSFDGAEMVENEILKIPELANPFALATPDPYPDVVMADTTGITHYSFNGSNMVENPALSVSGLVGVTSIGAAGVGQIAILADGGVQHYSLSNNSMTRNEILEPAVTLDNPIDIALAADGYNTAVLENDRIRWFNFTGTDTKENTALAVTGLNDAKAFSIADPNNGYDIAVLDGTAVKHYSFTGSEMKYNSTLSVVSGLTAPQTVAVRPGSFDRIIVDGNEIKYYQWNGSSLLYNENLSVNVANIMNSNGYVSSAIAQSVAFTPGFDTDYVCVRAVHVLPDKTSVTWSVTADGVNWVKKWRVVGTPVGANCEISNDGGETWTIVGDDTQATPDAINEQLWVNVNPGQTVKWKAELATADFAVTPVIATTPRGGTAVRLITNSSPLPPELPTYGSCFSTTTPILEWTFQDLDPGDIQGKYRVQIVKASDLSLLIDTGEVACEASGYQIETSMSSETPSTLWSSGTYLFKYRVMVWDQAGAFSPWSEYGDFCIIGYERPRITEIISPPAGQVSPDPADISTHIVITPGMTHDLLPRVKAGAKTAFMVDSIGPITEFTPIFPYQNQLSSINSPEKLSDETTNPMYSLGNAVNRWCVEFWTDANLKVCPTETVIQANLAGNSERGETVFAAPPYSDGIAVTEGSIYGDWQVILQGRNN